MRDTLAPSPAAPVRPGVRHLLDATTLDRAFIEGILGRALAIEGIGASVQVSSLREQILATLFYEPSTRTRFSLEAAMLRLGGQVISAEDASRGSSAAKGETLEDTIRIVAGYADLIALRHPEMGAAGRAATVSPVPILNAGDGAGQHPTQGLLDVFTIQRELGRLDQLRVAMVGDLAHGRTVHSIALLLSCFPANELIFVAPASLRIGEDILGELRARGTSIREETDLDAVAGDLDVLYQTRIQRERFASEADYEDVRGVYVVDEAVMRRLPKQAILMHPLPRLDEIDPAVDSDPRAAYFRQARNGLFVRMAVLEWLAGI